MNSWTITSDHGRSVAASHTRHAPPVILAWFAAIVAGVGSGAVLGWWCRATVGSHSIAGVLAELGAPWIATSFAAGALARVMSAGRRPRGTRQDSVGVSTAGWRPSLRPRSPPAAPAQPPPPLRVLLRSRPCEERPRLAETRAHNPGVRPSDGVSTAVGSAVAGALAGAICLVVATGVYYGPARTGRLDVAGVGSSAAVWGVVGAGVGVLFGALGALWWSAPTRRQATVCLVAVGTAITAEAYYLLDSGVASDLLVRNVLVGVAITGAAVPLLLGVRWHAVAGIALVAVFALPVSLAAEIVSVGALDSIVHLRAFVSRH